MTLDELLDIVVDALMGTRKPRKVYAYEWDNDAEFQRYYDDYLWCEELRRILFAAAGSAHPYTLECTA